MIYDAIILGLGGMGSATLAHLASRGFKVLGIEQFPLVHQRGSSHGQTRIIRTAYAEHPSYVPLVRRSFELWSQLESGLDRRLLTPSPCLNIGPPSGAHVRGVLASVREHNLDAEWLPADEINRRFPAFKLPESYGGVLEQTAGILRVEECVRAHLDWARSTGNATIIAEEAALDWSDNALSVEVTTKRGKHVAKHLVITCGAWATRILSDLQLPIGVMRQVQMWFEPEKQPELYKPGQFPLFIVETPDGDYYGFPFLDHHGIKCARHYGAPISATPDEIDWQVHSTDEFPIRQFMNSYFRHPPGKRLESSVCMYTVSQDHHFIVDRHPKSDRVYFATGFSGHGFKFATVIGEILADFVEKGQTHHPVDLFRSSRFLSPR